jgi:hypothetical protein
MAKGTNKGVYIMKFAHILTIAAAAALFSAPVKADDFHKPGGFSFEANLDIKAGGAGGSADASGEVKGHAKEVTNHSDTYSESAEFSKSGCTDCDHDSTHGYYSYNEANNNISVLGGGEGEHGRGGAFVESNTSASSSSGIGEFHGSLDVSGHH